MGLPYEFYWVSNLLVLIGLLLFVVMLRVVEIVDFSRGSIRVECNLKFFLLRVNTISITFTLFRLSPFLPEVTGDMYKKNSTQY